MTRIQRPNVSASTLLVIGLLYVTQGIPMGLGFIAFPAILRQLGYSTQDIGFVGLILVPWAIKFLWAPVVDRWNGGPFGARRSWIIPAQLVLAALYFGIAFLPAGQTPAWLLLGALLAANFVSATQDIATDGLAVEALQGTRFGSANGLQIGGFCLGMLIGGAVTLVVFELGGWGLSFALLGLATALTLIPVLLTTERHARPELVASGRPVPSLANMVRRRGAGLILSIAASFHFCSTMLSSMSGPFMVDAGLSLTEIGVINGTGTAIIAILGSIAGTALIHRFGVRTVAIAAGAATACSLGLWVLPALAGTITFSTALSIAVVTGLAGGVAYVAFYSLFMAWASLEQAGTDFTVLQCTESLTNIIAAILAGQLAAAIGFTGLFAVIPLLGGAILLWIVFATKKLETAQVTENVAEAYQEGERG